MYIWGLMELNKDFGESEGGKFAWVRTISTIFSFSCLTPQY